MEKINNKKIVLVEWEDATFFHSDYTAEKIEEDIEATTCRNIGFLLVENDKKIIVAGQDAKNKNWEEELYSDITIIPKSWVTKITILEEGGKNEK